MPSIRVNADVYAVTHPPSEVIERLVEEYGGDRYGLEAAIEAEFTEALQREFRVDPSYGEAPGWNDITVTVEVDY